MNPNNNRHVLGLPRDSATTTNHETPHPVSLGHQQRSTTPTASVLPSRTKLPASSSTQDVVIATVAPEPPATPSLPTISLPVIIATVHTPLPSIPSPSPSPHTHSHPTARGAIAGIAIGATVALILLILIAWLIFRKRRLARIRQRRLTPLHLEPRIRHRRLASSDLESRPPQTRAKGSTSLPNPAVSVPQAAGGRGVVSDTGLVQELFENREFESQLLHFISQRTEWPLSLDGAALAGGGGGGTGASAASRDASSGSATLILRRESIRNSASEPGTQPPAYASRPATAGSPSP